MCLALAGENWLAEWIQGKCMEIACHRGNNSDCCCCQIIREFCLIVFGIPILLRPTPPPLPSHPVLARDNGGLSVLKKNITRSWHSLKHCKEDFIKWVVWGIAIKICMATTASGSCCRRGEIEFNSEYNKRDWKFVAKERGRLHSVDEKLLRTRRWRGGRGVEEDSVQKDI